MVKDSRSNEQTSHFFLIITSSHNLWNIVSSGHFEDAKTLMIIYLFSPWFTIIWEYLLKTITILIINLIN